MAPPCGRGSDCRPVLTGALLLLQEVQEEVLGAPCYLLEALLVPGGAIDAVGGDLPPVGDILADLVAVAVPLPPLAVRLRCREAHLVLLWGHREEELRSPLVIQSKDTNTHTHAHGRS